MDPPSWRRLVSSLAGPEEVGVITRSAAFGIVLPGIGAFLGAHTNI